jgi:alpha-amylase/alpha-mannosidase (GH57 family)
MAPTYLMLLWHQHQPFYKDLVDDRYTMPWVRLHALKDYYGMVAELGAFPQVHATFNLVPSLVAQLEDYAHDRAREEWFELGFKPAAELSAKERERVFHYAFQANRPNLIDRYPRFRELYEKARPWELSARLATAFTEQEIRDLQVTSQLAWVDELWLASDPELERLVATGRHYTENDKAILRRKELEFLRAVLEEHRAAESRGQIELSTSPFYHPILPLLCDTDAGAESHPGLPLPHRRFRHPEDAAAQLRAARELHSRTFGRDPNGFWPSEGSLSGEVLRLGASQGFRWTASDEGVLSRSLGLSFARRADGNPSNSRELYRPHRIDTPSGSISVFFRDHEISDLVGFIYANSPPESAAASLLGRIRSAGRSTGDRPAVVPVILDGENCWEFYPLNGRPFLRAFYEMVARDPEIRAVTATEALELCDPGTLKHIVPGSWINANFDVWIGAEEDNRAWELLSNARDFFAANSAGTDPEKRRLAQEEIWIAEGSDWCWWYGPEHSTSNDEEFDWLFRKHLSNVYRLLRASAPDELAVPLKRPRGQALNVEPSGKIAPTIDGAVTNYFEWIGAGVHSPPTEGGSMHGPEPVINMVYYGRSDEAFYLRFDLSRVIAQSLPEYEIRITLEARKRLKVASHIGNGDLRSVGVWIDDVPVEREHFGDAFDAALGRVFEMRVSFGLLQSDGSGELRLQISAWANELPLQAIPQEGWLIPKMDGYLESW